MAFMAMPQSNHQFNAEIYKALMREDQKMVINLCGRVSEHALYTLTIHNDTVLHLATYSKQGNLVLELLRDLPKEHLDKMTHQNNSGNTILHETATSNQAVSIARVLLDKAPGLLGMRNNLGETALFRAARFGKNEIFYFLASKISEYNQTSQHAFLQRRDKTTILHIAILSHHFGLALKIAEMYPYIIGEQDIDGMTALQILSCNPSCFEKESEVSFFKRLMNYVKSFCSLGNEDELEMQKERYETVLKLAKFLIRRDTSWEISYPIAEESRPKPHRYGTVVSQVSPIDKKGSADQGVSSDQFDEEGETPLFLATKSGCVEIVREILKLYPQAVEHIDDEGRNILHVAIKYRQLEIFKLVKKMEIPMRWLVRKLDNKGNTLLHMAATKRSHYVPEKLQGPALELREEMLWFERVKKRNPAHLIDHHNSMQQTAESLFADANNELRGAAKNWIRSTAEGCSVVAVLFATVAFAAAYTVPGGANDAGFPVLRKHPLFVVFTVTDVLSLASSLTAVVTFLSLLSSSYRLEDFKHSLPNKLMLGFIFLFLAVTMMMVAFAATVLLMIHHGTWSNFMLYAVSFLPVSLFAMSHLPLHSALSITWKYLMKKVKRALLPWLRAKTPKVSSDYYESEYICHSNPLRCQCATPIIV